MMLFQTLAPALPQAIPKLAQDLLEAFGKKDFMPYLLGAPDIALQAQLMAAQEGGGTILPFNQEQAQPEAENPQPEAAGGSY